MELPLYDSKVDSTRNAVVSKCEKFRYTLFRKWDDSKPLVMFIMLNPSTADAMYDDPTIRRCIGFAKSWGFGGLYVGNLFAYRATDPKNLLTCENIIGADNKYWLDKMASLCEYVVVAWGNSTIMNKLTKKISANYRPLKGIENLHFIEYSNDGTPKHPLYLKGDLKPKKVSEINFKI
ncbi:DUF1643 domain-containing protein [Flavobacterium tructae]|uniref:DUF1643 domain-containing protein n=1 Tax=Flavobacterium tructae TaxID=1114873 RepID=A0A1S1J4P3_9FLAO|nr:DUF1643 domain-containing protein [Flavobacterium tructae]OHT44449.1 hypothetical protein BHE19_12070 [Flavobacterium tructae]OXB19415.1 hypothetical protein B0A71_12800 [Flavobacterium tructae]